MYINKEIEQMTCCALRQPLYVTFHHLKTLPGKDEDSTLFMRKQGVRHGIQTKISVVAKLFQVQ